MYFCLVIKLSLLFPHLQYLEYIIHILLRKNTAPNVHTPYPAMPTRTFLSLNGSHGPSVFDSNDSSKPWILPTGFCAAVLKPVAAKAAADPMKKFFLEMCIAQSLSQIARKGDRAKCEKIFSCLRPSALAREVCF